MDERKYVKTFESFVNEENYQIYEKSYEEHTLTNGDIEIMYDANSKMLDAYTYEDMVDDIKEYIPKLKFKQGKNPLFYHITNKMKTQDFLDELQPQGFGDITSMDESKNKMNEKGSKDVPDKHQKKILIDTVKKPNKSLMGGPDAKEAEDILKKKFGYSDDDIKKLKESKHKKTKG